MTRYKQIRNTASLVAQLLGLIIAILLLTNAGRYAVGKFGLLHVLLVALAFFVVAEVAIVFTITRRQMKSTSAAGQTSGAAAISSQDRGLTVGKQATRANCR